MAASWPRKQGGGGGGGGGRGGGGGGAGLLFQRVHCRLIVRVPDEVETACTQPTSQLEVDPRIRQFVDLCQNAGSALAGAEIPRTVQRHGPSISDGVEIAAQSITSASP